MSEDVATKIKSQVEFYFSGLNLKRDKFMREKMAADPEGFILIETLLTFNRLKQLTTDIKVVVDAIKDSDKLTFNEDFSKVKSNIDFQKPENNVSLRTIHMRGFPTSATLDDLIEGLKSYGNLRFVEMRRYVNNKQFKGSVNVEFNTKEDADAFMTKTVSFAGKEITDKQLLIDREKEQEEKDKRYSFCQDSIVQFRNVGIETANKEFRELLAPFMTENCFLLRTEGDNQAIVRFETSQMAATAIEGLKEEALTDKPLKMMVLHGKKANGLWTKIKAMMMRDERVSMKREHEEEYDDSSKIAKTEG